MLVSKWHMHRLGLIDFWYYVNEEFMFDEGHMLLRGSNGSGKSVTMQSFIPLLLDGNKSSERLDAFGTRSRKIENYLMEEDSERNERIAYLYLEFKREDSDIYKTIGMGLRARRNKPVETWYFVIEDNRRINYEIQLMDNHLAITKLALKNCIHEQLIEGQKEYMDRVNASLFGFPTRDDYREAINLLIQLRSPKLSNSLKPTMINEILSNSLQPLSEDDLRPMSEAISNMDEIKEQLDSLKQSYNAAKSIASVYEQYNHASLDKKLVQYMNEKQANDALQKGIQSLNHDQEAMRKRQAECESLRKDICVEEEVLQEQYQNLVQQDILQVVEKVAQCKQEVKQQEQRFHQKEEQKEKKNHQCIDDKTTLQNLQNKKEQQQYEMQKQFDEMTKIQEQIQFEEHISLEQEVMQNMDMEYNYTYTQSCIKEEVASLQAGLQHFQTVHNEQDMKERYQNEREKCLFTMEQQEKEKEQIQKQFYSVQEEYKEKFAMCNKENHLLQLTSEDMLSVVQTIENFEQEASFSNIDQLLQQCYFQKRQTIETKRIESENEEKRLQKELLDTKHTLHEWETMVDPQPILDTYMEKSRAYLEEQHIPYVPLYTLLEYEENVSVTSRDNFEEILLRMGLLNALLVKEVNRTQILAMPKGMADQFLFVDGDVTTIPVYEITEVQHEINVAALFHHFHIDTTQIEINQHWYQSGAITGTISNAVTTTFIGKDARERYRKAKIEELQIECKQYLHEIECVQSVIQQYMEDVTTLEKEYERFPKKDDLACALQEITAIDGKLSATNLQIKSLNEEISKKNLIIKDLYLKITEIANHLGISATYETFIERQQNFQIYAEYLQDFIMEHQQYRSSLEQWHMVNERLRVSYEDYDIICVEVETMERNIAKLKQTIAHMEEQLANQGYEEIKKKIETIQERRQQIPQELSKLDKEAGTIINALLNVEKELAEYQNRLHKKMEEQEAAFSIYQEEVKLYYVVKEDQDIFDVKQIHADIQSNYPALKSKEVLGNELQTTFYTNRGALQEYNLSMITLFEDYADGNSRLDVYARYKGTRISFMQLLTNLKEDIDKQSLLLEDSDRSLIEDILVNTISKKIRTHIQNSRHWVSVMNRYMNGMNTSSGLKLSLLWKSHKAENEEELSSENLIKLLEKDVRILKESDMKRLSSHFRSKITTARKVMDQQDNTESFHQIMRHIMDYRTWFDFTILYEKIGEKKKELTNNAFYAFSGGEKAMSMYVPLFSAVAAKFEGANEDAPLLIALDEAFAGVDEKNINNMFMLIAQFKFDYVMNSQVLWGDYPSVKALRIHELFRPENAHFVTVISYRWNGNKKVLIER